MLMKCLLYSLWNVGVIHANTTTSPFIRKPLQTAFHTSGGPCLQPLVWVVPDELEHMVCLNGFHYDHLASLCTLKKSHSFVRHRPYGSEQDSTKKQGHLWASRLAELHPQSELCVIAFPNHLQVNLPSHLPPDGHLL